VTNQTTKETTTVKDPEKYTFIFITDGSFKGKVDCNNIGGSYSQETGGLVIKLGASKMAFCCKDSMDFQYMTLLSNVAAGGQADSEGNLALEWAGVEQRILFQNGGPLRNRPRNIP
jgi:heat shock protein HslJ